MRLPFYWEYSKDNTNKGDGMYTSGRTVKSPARKPTTIASATADVRKLVRKHLPGVEGITVTSNGTADPKTLDHQIRTVITFPHDMEVGGLADALTALPNLVRADTDGCLTYTIVRAA